MHRDMFYILDENDNPQVCTLFDLAMFSDESPERMKVDFDQIGEVEISTIFLGIDHGFIPGQPPVLFETMVFGGKYNSYKQRYFTKSQAVEGHRQVVEGVRTDTLLEE